MDPPHSQEIHKNTKNCKPRRKHKKISDIYISPSIAADLRSVEIDCARHSEVGSRTDGRRPY